MRLATIHQSAEKSCTPKGIHEALTLQWQPRQSSAKTSITTCLEQMLHNFFEFSSIFHQKGRKVSRETQMRPKSFEKVTFLTAKIDFPFFEGFEVLLCDEL